MGDPRSVLITGATGKIGSQFVRHFLANGFTVIFTSRKENNIKKLCSRSGPKDVRKRLYGIRVDLEKESAAGRIVNFLKAKNLRLDSLINCARNKKYLKSTDGLSGRRALKGEFLMDVVVPYELSMALACSKGMRLKNIVNIASIYGIVPPNPGLYDDPKKECPIQYGIAKAALIHLTKELAIRLAGREIKVNSISYGGVEGRTDKRFEKKYAKLCPAGRMLKEKEVIGAADFLISDNSSGMTGHNLVVDGGWSAW